MTARIGLLKISMPFVSLPLYVRLSATQVEANVPPEERKSQFLWDYIAHRPEGILIAAESEFDQNAKGLQHDFEKLLYVRSPIKLMVTRVKSAAEAEQQRLDLRSYMDRCCTAYSPGEVFILYCVWWSEGEINRDLAYLLQVPGEPCHRTVDGKSFEALRAERNAA